MGSNILTNKQKSPDTMKSFTIAMIAATASSRWVTQSWCYKAGSIPDADGWW